jgi:hypothetical protein
MSPRRRDPRRKAELRTYLAKFPKALLVSREQAELEAEGGFPGQQTVWKLWDEFDRLCGKGRR